MGVSGKAQERAFIEPLKCKMDKHVTHSFLHIPKCPISLIGRDTLHKLGVTIHLMGDKLEIGIPLDRWHKMVMLMAEDKLPWTDLNN